MAVKKFNLRGFVSIFLFISMIVVTLSGVILFVAPSGRVAKTIDFRVLNLDKDQWTYVHTIFGYAMVVALVFHMVYNWKIFLSYFRRVVAKVRKVRLVETVVATLLSLYLFLGAVYGIEPISSIVNLSEKAKDYWEAKTAGFTLVESEESSHEYYGYGWKTVKEVADELGIPVETALENLQKSGIKADENTTIRTIMDATGKTSSDVISIIEGK